MGNKVNDKKNTAGLISALLALLINSQLIFSLIGMEKVSETLYNFAFCSLLLIGLFIFILPFTAIILGIVGIVKVVKNRARGLIYSILGIIGGVIPFIRFVKFCGMVSGIQG